MINCLSYNAPSLYDKFKPFVLKNSFPGSKTKQKQGSVNVRENNWRCLFQLHRTRKYTVSAEGRSITCYSRWQIEFTGLVKFNRNEFTNLGDEDGGTNARLLSIVSSPFTEHRQFVTDSEIYSVIHLGLSVPPANYFQKCMFDKVYWL
jgi:hypothetical protein